ncbi:MAG: class I SAM-dependent methyltransferase [Bacteroidales bacterium]|nr:class I SAM-dependent methyltransferase [Bacteroidales bacterium]
MTRRPEYDARFVVNFYAHFVEGLMKGEQMIIDTMGDQLPKWKMLDIGIGAGRTTRHFAPRVKEYLGVDYVPGMIEVVKRKFPHPEPHVKFEVADIQSMPQIPDSSVDFCLFSFNGLDCNPYEERMKGLSEISRMLKPGGYFLFSTHNLLAIDVIFEIEKTKNPVKLGYSIFKRILLHLMLGPVNKLKQKDHIYIRDAAHLFRVKHMYHKPAEVISQLKQVGFTEIRMFDYPECNEITGRDPATITDSAFVFFLAKR